MTFDPATLDMEYRILLTVIHFGWALSELPLLKLKKNSKDAYRISSGSATGGVGGIFSKKYFFASAPK